MTPSHHTHGKLAKRVICLRFSASAVVAGIIGGPQVCQVNINSAGVVSAIDNLVPNSDIAQFCAAMTASIAISCVGFVIVALWLWWTIWAIKSLRKDRKVRQDGVDYIVKEKDWGYSMSELLRRHPEIERYVVKRYGADGMEMSDIGSSEASGGSLPAGAPPFIPMINTTALSPGSGSGSGSDGMTAMPGTGTTMSMQSAIPHISHSGTHRPELPGIETQLNSPDTPYEGGGEMAPPPYIGAHPPGASASRSAPTDPTSAGGASNSAESTGGATADLIRNGSTSHRRPLPLAPSEVEQVVDRKMDEMASGSMLNTGSSSLEIAARGLGINTNSTASASGSRSGIYETTRATGSSPLAPPLGPLDMTMEELVDRKIDHAQAQAQSSTSHSTDVSHPHHPQHHPATRVEPLVIPTENSTWPGASQPPTAMGSAGLPPLPTSRLPSATGGSSAGGMGSGIGRSKAAEAGFTIEPPPGTSTWAHPGSAFPRPREVGDEMTLEEMIERKLRSLKEERERATASTTSSRGPLSAAANSARIGEGGGGGGSMGSPWSPLASGTGSYRAPPAGLQALQGSSGSRPAQGMSAKARGKRRARAGSDPGPAIVRSQEEDEDEEGY